MKHTELLVACQIDCEATQPAIHDAALGMRASRGFADVLESAGLKGTFYCIPSEVRENAALYRELEGRGHEIGLHVHPADLGYEEFLGIYGPDEQREILDRSAQEFAQAMGRRPTSVCIGYGSSNDHTHRVLVELGFTHGLTQVPGRILPECASVGAGACLDPHYAHPWNRVLTGGLDFVETPATIDPDSRMWGGKHPQDLRVELVDAKNHYYTIAKSVKRQSDQDTPLRVITLVTHNIFEYGDPRDFRRQTLEGMIGHVRGVAQQHELRVVAVTHAQLAAIYRRTVPQEAARTHLALDRRGYAATTPTPASKG
jgi:hypothetical protein